MASSAEVVLNLWYVEDEQGVIYSLRAKAYCCRGSDEEKLAFLQERSLLDYLIAGPFEIPSRFHIAVGSGAEEKRLPVAHSSMIQTLDSPIALFEDAIQVLEEGMPVQSEISIPSDPLVCTTALRQGDDGTLQPSVGAQARF